MSAIQIKRGVQNRKDLNPYRDDEALKSEDSEDTQVTPEEEDLVRIIAQQYQSPAQVCVCVQ